MKRIVIVSFLLHLLWLSFSCKKKSTIDDTYVKPEQKYTDIPGTDISFASNDTAFMDTGNVITIRGKGFDPKLKDHYILQLAGPIGPYYEDTSINYPKLSYSIESPKSNIKLISMTDSEIRFQVDKFTLGVLSGDCIPYYIFFNFYKYSDDPVASMDYKKRYVLSGQKRYTDVSFYQIYQDTLYLKRGVDLSPRFIYLKGNSFCYNMFIDNSKLGECNYTAGTRVYPFAAELGIPADVSKLKIPDGYHTIQLKRTSDGKVLHELNHRYSIYIKTIQ